MYVIDQLTASSDGPGLLYNLLIIEDLSNIWKGIRGPYMTIPDC